MVEKVIRIKTESDLDEVNDDAIKLANSLDEVDDASKKAATSVDDVAGNGGAIAILDQLTGGLATRMRDAFEATKLFNFSLKGTKTALIATGIGAFVVALGLVVAYWDEIVEFITSANEKLQEQIDLSNDILENLSFELKLLEAKEKILEAEGKSTVEIRKQKQKILELQQLENAQLISNLKLQLQKETSTAKEATFLQKLLGLRGALATTNVQGTINEEEQQRIDDINKQLQEAILKTETLKLALIEINKPTEEEKKKEEEEDRGIVSPITNLPIETLIEALDVEFEITKMGADRLNNLLAQKSQQRIEQAQAEAQLKRDILFAEAELLGQFGGLLEQIGEKNKAIAVAGIIASTIASSAQILLSTTEANAKAVAASPLTFGQPWVTLNSISAGIGIASGAVAAGKAISQLGGGGSAPTAPTLAPQGSGGAGSNAPEFNLVNQNTGNQIADSLADNPIKAFVVSKDMTNQQEFDRETRETASIG